MFDEVQMTWQLAHKFCLEQASRLARWTELQDINEISPFLNHERRYWINSDQNKVYSLHDALQDWYWPDGKQFNAWHKRGLHKNLSYNGEEERCAIIRESKNGIWEDSPCGAPHLFFCKKAEVTHHTVFIVYISINNADFVHLAWYMLTVVCKLHCWRVENISWNGKAADKVQTADKKIHVFTKHMPFASIIILATLSMVSF